jgi:hypothetical protein
MAPINKIQTANPHFRGQTFQWSKCCFLISEIDAAVHKREQFSCSVHKNKAQNDIKGDHG